MKSFREFKKGTLTVFDVDDTLFQTHARIKVIKNGKIIHDLSNREFNEYKLGKDEYFDFSNFRDANHFRNTSIPMQKMLDMAARIVYNNHENSETILLTARADFDDRDIFLQTFRDHGFPIDQVYVERAGNLGKLDPKITANISKMVVLRKYINSGKFNRIRIFDDSEKNLKSILKLTKIHPEIKVDAYRVYHNGNFERCKL